ncbi:TIGR04283 family arsenosugar biosynthesis glycosyltransferase [Candidatus Woesearchaeota archaeon]|nr:TIGR04283 family arsenosugar biosynthesis glycosyltransferase [Candidatus Woesearchaeota archaeon]
MISIILPARNEEKNILHVLGSIQKQRQPCPPYEVLVCDAGSTDKTGSLVRGFIGRTNVRNIHLINYEHETHDHRKPNRARVMNFCAGKASGKVLLFLHADCILPHTALSDVAAEIEKGVQAGAFLVKYNNRNPLFRLGEIVSRWRTLHVHRFYGDQAIFIRADAFKSVGGYYDFDLFEDFDFCSRLRKRCKIGIIRKYVVSSARKYTKYGIINQYLDNQIVELLFRFGVETSKLRKIYKEIRVR